MGVGNEHGTLGREIVGRNYIGGAQRGRVVNEGAKVGGVHAQTYPRESCQG